jgi:CHAT domain-containing protein
MRSAVFSRLVTLLLGCANWQFCASAPAPTDTSNPCAVERGQPIKGGAAQFEAMLHNDPIRALAWACAQQRRADSLDASVNIVRALTAASRTEAADVLLSKLDSSLDLSTLDKAKLEVARVYLLREMGKYATSAEHAERALALLSTLAHPPAPLMVRALIARASAARSLNKTNGLRLAAEAVDAAEKLAINAGLSASYEMTFVLNQRTMLAYTQSDLPGTLRWALRERDLVRKLSGPNAPAQLDALATLGGTTSQQRNFEASAKYLYEGRRIGRLAPAASRLAYLGILNTLTLNLNDLGQPLASLDVAREAVALAESTFGVGSPQSLLPLQRRAWAEESLQRFVQARRSYDQVLAILQKDAAQIPMARRLSALDASAAYFLRVGDTDAAQRLVDQILVLSPPGGGLPYWRGRGLRRAALVAGAQSQWMRADTFFQQARPLIAATIGDSHGYITSAEVMRCELQMRGGLAPVACDEVATRVDGLRDAGPSELMRARLALSRHAAAKQQHALAFEHLLTALAVAQSTETVALLWQALGAMAMHVRSNGQLELAVVLAKKAVEQIEDVRRQFVVARDFNTGFFADRLAVYRQLADWLLQDRRLNEAEEILRLLKGEEYRNFVGGWTNAEPPPKAKMHWAAAELRWLAQSPLADTSAIAAVRKVGDLNMQALRDQERARAQSWRLALQLPLAGVSSPAAEPAPNASPAAVAPGELIATVFLGEAHVNFLFRTQTDHRLVRLPADTVALVRDIGRVLTQLEQRAEVLPLLQSLFERAAAPIHAHAQHLGVKRLALRLEGDLRYLPFAALHDGKAYLIERYAIEQQAVGADAPVRPAATASKSARAPAADARQWVNAFGSTREMEGLPSLPGVVTEICGIVNDPGGAAATALNCPLLAPRGAVPGRAWIDDAFTRQNLRQAAASGQTQRLDLLHIGTHFVLRPGEIGRSWMQLGDGQKLYLHELLTWRLRSQELVTLSACQTGVGGGGEVEGLATLMLNLGAQAVIASLWRVEDRSTADLMRGLYAQIHAGADPALALQQAQLQALAVAGPSSRAHPFHWAGFYLSTRGR